MNTAVTRWLRQNPERDNDTRETIIVRTVFERLIGNLYNPALSAYPAEVNYDTVWKTLVRTRRLTEDTPDFRGWRDAMDLVWGEVVPFFRAWFTKPQLRDD